MRSSVPASRSSSATTSQVRTVIYKALDYANARTVDHLIPMDSRVEIDAKIAAGYFTSGKQVTEQDLSKTVGRGWEEADH